MATTTIDYTVTEGAQVIIGREDVQSVRTVTEVTLTVAGETHGLYRLADGRLVTQCGRCAGHGGRPGTIPTFGYVFGGICFECNGCGFRRVIADEAAAAKGFVAAAKRRAKAAAARDAKAAAYLAVRDAKRDAWVAANVDLAARLAAYAVTADTEDAYWAAMSALPTRNLADLADLARDAADTGLNDMQVERANRILGYVDADTAKAATATHVGTVGEKVTVTGPVTFTKVIEGNYGSKMLVKVQAGTAEVVTFTTAAWAWKVEDGDEVTLTGTVTEHGDYQGAAQTTITRAKQVA